MIFQEPIVNRECCVVVIQSSKKFAAALIQSNKDKKCRPGGGGRVHSSDVAFVLCIQNLNAPEIIEPPKIIIFFYGPKISEAGDTKAKKEESLIFFSCSLSSKALAEQIQVRPRQRSKRMLSIQTSLSPFQSLIVFRCNNGFFTIGVRLR